MPTRLRNSHLWTSIDLFVESIETWLTMGVSSTIFVSPSRCEAVLGTSTRYRDTNVAYIWVIYTRMFLFLLIESLFLPHRKISQISHRRRKKTRLYSRASRSGSHTYQESTYAFAVYTVKYGTGTRVGRQT